MAYSVHNISALTDVPALVGAFALANGFDTDLSDANAPIITCPGDSNSVETNLPVRLQATISGTNNQNHDLFWSTNVDSNSAAFDTDNSAFTTSPKLNGSATNNPTVSLPTKVHIFGGAVGTNSPFIAIVIEYGFNLYRHLFFGKMEARGDYTGREVCCGATGPRNSSGSVRNWYSSSHGQFLFSAAQELWSASLAGFCRIVHADNPTEFRTFTRPITTTTPFDEFTNAQVVGGFQDAFNDGFVARGISPFSGVVPLVPINLYAPMPIVGDTSFVPIGRPPGVRLVNMRDLEPGQQIEVGNETWRVFPHSSKREDLTITPNAFNWPTLESSYYLGYAYLEEDLP